MSLITPHERVAPGRDDRDVRHSRAHLEDALHGRATRGTALTVAGQGGRFLLQTLSTVILARLLTPADYGLVGMVVALSGLALLVTRMGLSQATVQRGEITDDQVNALFWLNVAMGAFATVTIVAAAPLIASFYGRPELVGISAAFALTFLLDGFSVQHEALLTRLMRFGWLSAIETVSLAGGVVVALLAAWMGAGYWALVLLHLGDRTTRLVCVWVATGWRPGRPRRADGVRDLVTFGANLGVFGVLNYLSRQLDNVLIGRAWGAGPLGLYAKAYQLLLLPIQQINVPVSRVALPTLSLLQDDPERYRRYYKAAIGAMAYVAMPLIVMMAVLSDEIVHVLLGPQWAGAAPIFRVLAFAGIAQTVAHANGWIYVSTGHTGRQAVWGLVSRPVIVLSFLIGLPGGPYGVAVSYTVATILLLPPAFVVAVRGTPLSVSDIAEAAWRPLLTAAVLFVVTTWSHGFFTDLPLLPRIATTLAVGAAVYVTIVLGPRGGRREAIELIALIRTGLRPRERAEVGS